MFVLLTPSMLAALIARVQGRSLARLAHQPLAWWPLGLLALAAEVALSSAPIGRQPWAIDWGSSVWMMALSMMIAVLDRNSWQRTGPARWAWGAATLGAALNLLVMLANGEHMPLSETARTAPGVPARDAEPVWHHVAPIGPETRLAWLGDVLAEPAWLPRHNALSVGDVLLAGGLSVAAYLATDLRAARSPALSHAFV